MEDAYRRFLQGESAAFDEIVMQYRVNLIFFIDRYVHDTATAEDLSIDAFTELLLHPHRYNFKTSLKTYLFTIGRNRALDHLRHKNRIKQTALTEAETVTDGKTPEEELIKSERQRAVHEALSRLPEEERAAVHLYYFEELSYIEIAAVLHKNKKQVDNLLYRAKKELRDLLTGVEEL